MRDTAGTVQSNFQGMELHRHHICGCSSARCNDKYYDNEMKWNVQVLNCCVKYIILYLFSPHFLNVAFPELKFYHCILLMELTVMPILFFIRVSTFQPVALCVTVIDECGYKPAVVMEGPSSPSGSCFVFVDLWNFALSFVLPSSLNIFVHIVSITLSCG